MFHLILLISTFTALLWYLLSPPRRLKMMGNMIPGPKTYPLVGNIFNYNFIGTGAPNDWKKCFERYGPSFRYWLGRELHVAVSEPGDVQMVLSSQATLNKSTPYKILDKWLGTGLLISSGYFWQRRRKAITPAFHFKILEDFVPIFNKCAMVLVECLEKQAGEPPFPITEFMSNCALDAVAETAMGTKLNAQTNPLDKYPDAIVRMTKSLIKRMVNPLLSMEPIYTLSGRRKMESDLLKILFSVPLEVIKQKEKTEVKVEETTEEETYGVRKKTAFLERLLKMKQENDPAFQTDQDLLDEVIMFMFAGHDTTTMALSYTTWLLGLHPEIQEELYQEIKNTFGEGEPTSELYQRMTYLDRVVKESLRLYPSVPVIGRSASDDIFLPVSGHLVPKGAQIDVYLYSLHRRKDLFPDAEKFIPNRFLEPQKHPFSYLPFSAGPRNCIGQKFALLLIKVVLCHFVLKYKIEATQDMTLCPEMLLRTSSTGPSVSLTLRS